MNTTPDTPAEQCTDPRHTGRIRAQLGCTGPDPATPPARPRYWLAVSVPADAVDAHLSDALAYAADRAEHLLQVERGYYDAIVWVADDEQPAAVNTEEDPADAARRFARRLAAVEHLCSGKPGYHTITVKALLTAMSDADDDHPADREQPRPHPHATVTLRPNPADPAEVTVEAESHDVNPAEVATLPAILTGDVRTGQRPAGLDALLHHMAEEQQRAKQPTTPRILTADEYENAYAAARGDLGRYRAQLGSAIVADTVTSTLAAVGLIAPPPTPEPDTCPAQFADREGAWHQCEEDPGHDPATGHGNDEWSWPDGVWFAGPDEDDDA